VVHTPSPAVTPTNLLGNALLGAWWLDPIVGLLIAGVAVKEGCEAWRGDGCCVSSPLDGAGFAEDGCEDECCAPAALVPILQSRS
jgi:hypothetical protein